ncbi:hypothetical protein [Hydrogenimonas sp.]
MYRTDQETMRWKNDVEIFFEIEGGASPKGVRYSKRSFRNTETM